MADRGPYLSLVVTARNDNHGGNLLRRMQIFVDGWIAQARRHNLSSELIVVEWNPVADKPRLWEALKWPQDSGPCDVRFIEVPEELHRRYAHAAALPLYQMIAKNVGIRRARGQFILATNIDILFSDELVKFLSERSLDPNRMYRVDRHDVMSDVPADASIDEQLKYCESHLLRVNAREGTFPLTPDGRRALAKPDIASIESCIGFGRGWFAVERWSDYHVFRWMDREAEIEFTLPAIVDPVLRLELEPGPSACGEPVTLEIFHDKRSLAAVEIEGLSELSIPVTDRSLRQGIRFRVLGGGIPIEHDPRILNLRVFSCRWVASNAAANQLAAKAGPPSIGMEGVPAITLRRVSPFQKGLYAWRQLQGLIRRSANEGPNVTFTIPEFYRHLAASYVEWGGITGMIRHSVAYLRRKPYFHRRATGAQDIFDDATGVRGGLGWHPWESFRGEVFRWANPEGEILLPPTRGTSATLLLQIEPGPGMGSKPFELLVTNQYGAVVARAEVKRLAFLRIPLPRTPGRTEVFTLGCAAGGMKSQDDSRTLSFRIFWCGVKQEPAAEGACPAIVIRRNPARGFVPISVDGHADLAVAGPATVPAHLYLDIAVSEGDPESLVFLGPAGETLATCQLAQTQVVILDLPLRASRTSVFRMELSPSDSKIARARLSWLPPRAVDRLAESVGVEGTGESDLAMPQESGPLSDLAVNTRRAPVPASFLHTNGCGDFTLLSRQKWLDLRAYPEFDLFSMNIDSVFCYAAHHGGARELQLPDSMRIYHIEHGSGSGWTPEGEARLFNRVKASGLTFLSNTEVVSWAAQMRRLDCPFIFNRDNWGLAEFNLPETKPALQPRPLSLGDHAAPAAVGNTCRAPNSNTV
jgi:hypothetical protein